MDWNELQDGLTAALSAATGIVETSVYWDGEPDGFRAYPKLDLLLRSHDDEHEDEVRLSDQEDGDDLAVELVGNRRMVLVVKATSRDQTPNERAYAVLERLRARLGMPATVEQLALLGVSVRDTAAVVDLSRTHDHREESVAALDVALSWAESVVDDGAGALGTIEAVEVGGTVQDGQTTITIPDRELTADSP